jgi:carboxynorspermidine decarboxylase
MSAAPGYAQWDAGKVPQTPAFVINTQALKHNGAILQEVQQLSGCKILLALKAFACPALLPLLKPYLAGTTASGLHEACLGHEAFGAEVHVYSPAYREAEVAHLCRFAHTLIFNTPQQWRRYRPIVEGARRRPQVGLRVNPGHSEAGVPLYDPCLPGSRLGYPAEDLCAEDLDGVQGLHFHTLCEQGADVLERTLEAFEQHCSRWFERLQWLNFGGGHHITQPDYDRQRLVGLLKDWRARYGLPIILEPGEAAAVNTGCLVATVCDVFNSRGTQVAILDTSATAHMPDTLEMPYRPEVVGAGPPKATPHTYRLGGLTCLAGDVIGDYSFPEPLEIGQRLVFTDMAHYTMVKTTTFNGVQLPDIVSYCPQSDRFTRLRRFGYQDFRDRLG